MLLLRHMLVWPPKESFLEGPAGGGERRGGGRGHRLPHGHARAGDGWAQSGHGQGGPTLWHRDQYHNSKVIHMPASITLLQ